MSQPKIRGRRTAYSRPLTEKAQMSFGNQVEDFEPQVPSSITLSETPGKDGGESTCGLMADFGKKLRVWLDAEVVLALAKAQGLADQFYDNGKLLCGIAIGVINRQI